MNKFIEFFSGIGSKLQALSTARKVITVAVTATTLTIGGGAAVVSTVGGSGGAADTETIVETETNEYIEETETTELETETETTEETTTEEKEITVTIKSTTIFEDLKIKIVDKNGNLVKGFPFEVVVTPINGEEGDDRTPVEFNDHDMDGIMHLKEMKGGDYIIDLKELEGIIISKNSVKAIVKGELEYEKVDNKDEIKKDDASQDTAENNVVVEAVLQDTLPLLESKPYPVEVAKDKVDLSNFPAGSVDKECTTATLNKTEKVEPTEVSILSVERYTVMSANFLGENMTEMSTSAAIQAVAESGEANVSPVTGESQSSETETTTQAAPETTTQAEPETTTQAAPETTTQAAPETTTQAAPETTTQAAPETTTSASTENSSSTSTESMGSSENNSSSENGSSSESGSTEGSSEAAPDEPSEEKVVASATVKLPKKVTLYHYGNENSKKAKLSLDITDKDGIIVADGIKWSISSTDVADMKVSEDKKSAELVAKKAGTATIVIDVKYVSGADGKTTTSQISSTVTVGNHTDNKTHLKSTSNQPLYIDSDATKIATPANYASAKNLYTTPKYTGWQTINGKLYYYKADNTPATGGQVIGGVQYNFNNDGSLIPSAETYGIDVSKWQGNIDWKAVSQSGVKFAIIRCAYRGAKDGLIHEDPYFKANIKGATQNGIKVGVYFFSQAINEVEAIEEASMAIGLVQGYHLNFPIFIDTEKATNGRANSLDRATRTKVVKAFCETVRNSGYKPGIYASKSWYNNNLDMSQLSSYNIWVAQYNTSCTYTGKYDMWQYTDSGSVPGIKGSVDMNKCYTNY